MALSIFTEGITLGLALGTSCLITCIPIFLPVIMQKKQSMKKGVKAVLFFSSGRFISYAAFGAISGLIGAGVSKHVTNKHYIVSVSYLLIAIYLIYSAVIRGKEEKGQCPSRLLTSAAGHPVILGMLTGINICPPFLAAVTRSFGRGNVVDGILLFTGFFWGTTVYLLPMSMISHFTKKKIFRMTGVFFSIIMGLWFVFLSADAAFHLRYKAKTFVDDKKVLDFSRTPVTLIDLSGEKKAIDHIKKRLPVKKTFFINFCKLKETLETLERQTPVLIIFSKSPEQIPLSLIHEKKLYVVWITIKEQPLFIAEEAVRYFEEFAFKASREKGFFHKLNLHNSFDN